MPGGCVTNLSFKSGWPSCCVSGTPLICWVRGHDGKVISLVSMLAILMLLAGGTHQSRLTHHPQYSLSETTPRLQLPPLLIIPSWYDLYSGWKWHLRKDRVKLHSSATSCFYSTERRLCCPVVIRAGHWVWETNNGGNCWCMGRTSVQYDN